MGRERDEAGERVVATRAGAGRYGDAELMSVEESIVRHVRENPALYVFAAALLIGVLIAKLVLEARRTADAPLL